VALTQLLVGACLGAVALQFLAAGEQFLLNDVAALLAILNFIELGAGLLDAGIEQGDTGEFVDQAATITGPHRDDAGHIPLHHHVAALGIHAQAAQLALHLLQVASHSVGAVAAAVGATWGEPKAPGDTPFLLAGLDPGPFGWNIKTFFGRVGMPVGEIEAHGDLRFGRLALPHHGAVDQVRQPLGPHATAVGQAKAEQNGIENVAFP